MSEFISMANEEALSGALANDGGPFGAVITKDGKVLSRGHNEVLKTNDPTAHAEMVAIRRAVQALGSYDLSGCEIHSSCEPCPMCLAAAYWARISRIVFANSRAEAAAIGFCDDDLYCELAQPLTARRVPTYHLPLAGADAPLRQWLASPKHIHY